MDEMEKLLRKVGKKEREKLKAVLVQLVEGLHEGLKIKKIQSLKCYRIRVGRFRVFFRVKKNHIEIIAIKLRNEGTYK